MNILVIDVGGNHVKILATGQEAPRKFSSGPPMAPGPMAAGVVLTTALFERYFSRGEADFADKRLSAMRFQFGGHHEKTAGK